VLRLRILLTRDSLAVRTVAMDSENIPPSDMETTHASKVRAAQQQQQQNDKNGTRLKTWMN